MKNMAKYIAKNCIPIFNRLIMKKQRLQSTLEQLKRKIAEELERLGVKQEKALKLLDADSITFEKKKVNDKEYWYLRFWDESNRRRALYAGTYERAQKIQEIWKKFAEERDKILLEILAIEENMREFEFFADFLRSLERRK